VSTPSAQVVEIFERINAMSPSGQLVLAAELLQRGELGVAQAIIQRISDDLKAAIALGLVPPRAGKEGGKR
jgi:hypothetical protein